MGRFRPLWNTGDSVDVYNSQGNSSFTNGNSRWATKLVVSSDKKSSPKSAEDNKGEPSLTVRLNPSPHKRVASPTLPKCEGQGVKGLIPPAGIKPGEANPLPEDYWRKGPRKQENE